eukprot:1833122-Pyramimonas_sp.AAC.1
MASITSRTDSRNCGSACFEASSARTLWSLDTCKSSASALADKPQGASMILFSFSMRSRASRRMRGWHFRDGRIAHDTHWPNALTGYA